MLKNESVKTTRIIQGAMGASIVGFLVFNKLPIVGRIQNKPMRFITRLGLLVAPTYVIANKMIPKLAALKDLVYERQ